jgi:hypothetical protein
VILGLITCITFIAATSSNGPNDWKKRINKNRAVLNPHGFLKLFALSAIKADL